ncbi:MAG: hypothetical protein J6M92_07665 [Oribacterium sp.]|nr:hypothetical protein [Oribacterium sp.]
MANLIISPAAGKYLKKIAANVQNSFFNDYFNKGFESFDDVHSYYVQSMVNVQKTYDFYKDLGLFDQYSNLPIIISFIEDDTRNNASCSSTEACMTRLGLV